MTDLFSFFADCIITGDFDSLRAIMSPDGKFTRPDPLTKVDTDWVSIDQLVNWLEDSRSKYIEQAKKFEKYNFSKCNGCDVGCTVVYFDDGTFPNIIPNLWTHRGLALREKGGLINEIKTCKSFEAFKSLKWE